MNFPIGAIRHGYIVVVDPDTGELAAPSSGPTVTIERQGAAVAPTMAYTNPSTGKYRYSYTVGAWTDGDSITEIIDYTSGGLAKSEFREYAIGGGGGGGATAAEIDALLTASHGGGLWQKSDVIAQSVTGEGATYPVSDDFTVRTSETFGRIWLAEGVEYEGDAYTFTVKRSALNDDDSAALLMVRQTVPADATNDGLMIMNGRPMALASRSLASLTVDADTDTSMAVSVKAAAMALQLSGAIDQGAYEWAIHAYNGTEKKSIAGGQMEVVRNVRRSATSPGV